MKNLFLLIALAAIAVAIFYLQSLRPPKAKISGPPLQPTMDKKEKAKRYPPAQEITRPAGFINTPGVTIGELIGKKVVLVDFWTYSCINCQRTIPYLTSWYEKYKDSGLEIIGVHTPEFKFEQKYENVSRAVKQFGIKYPVVLDNDYATWHAYKNRYWPRKYLIDIDGFIVYDHIGEGAYEETERKIQALLEERRMVLGKQKEISKEISRPASAEVSEAGSQEIYFGAARNDYLGNGKSGRRGRQTLKEPAGLKTNILYLDGDWNFEDEFTENQNAGAKIIFRYRAKNVFLVAGAEKPVKLKIIRDGKPIDNEAGSDAQAGIITVREERLYKLIEDTTGFGEHTLEIIIENPGLRAFTFTFG